MANSFERFSEDTRRVLTISQEEAIRYSHGYIDTEHILLALTREADCVAFKIMVTLGVELDKIRPAIELIAISKAKTFNEIGLTGRVKKVIELAVDETRKMNLNYVGTEHLLIGLIREGKGLASSILKNLGLNLANVREQTAHIFSQSQEQIDESLASSGVISHSQGKEQAWGYTLEMHGIMAAADPEWVEKYNAFIEATYTGQRLLDRKTKELLQIVVEAALRADVDQIRAHMKVALQEGATPQEILEALETVAMPMGGLAFRRGLQAWAAETGFDQSSLGQA